MEQHTRAAKVCLLLSKRLEQLENDYIAGRPVDRIALIHELAATKAVIHLYQQEELKAENIHFLTEGCVKITKEEVREANKK